MEKKYYKPKTLRSIALDNLVNLTVLGAYKIYTKTTFHERGREKKWRRRNVIDLDVKIKSNIYDVRDYIINIPSDILDEYVKLVIM